MLRLIVNADDFGLTSGVNRAISLANREGIVTSATVMANSRAFQEAVDVAKQQPGLHTGCHVVLIDGEPLSRNASTLTNSSPRFRCSLKKFAIAALRDKFSAEEVQEEAAAQILQDSILRLECYPRRQPQTHAHVPECASSRIARGESVWRAGCTQSL